MKNSIVAFQWRQLVTLTFAHAVVDLYIGCLTPVLVPMRDRYGISLPWLIFVATLMGFSSYVFQIVIGNMRARWTGCGLIIAGLFCGGTAVLVPNLPTGATALYSMSAVALLAGFGVAAVHPEGLRAVQGLTHIPSAVATPFFMVFGFLGFASGAWVSTAMTEWAGLSSLLWLYALAPIAAVALLAFRVRLPKEQGSAGNDQRAAEERMPKFPFWPLFVVASLLATASQIQATLLPSYLHDNLHYSLSFSGLSFTLFGFGGMAGSIFWGAMAKRWNISRILAGVTAVGAPLTLVYLLVAPASGWAAALLGVTGVVVYTGFPFCVTLARYSESSLRQSQRMGWASGGTWGMAAVVMWCISPFTETLGMGVLLHLVWVCYLLALAVFLVMWRRARREGKAS
jgi:FSR family fosmidomycin resistance protein-like MFS transporter